jgi:hypothetical protein
LKNKSVKEEHMSSEANPALQEHELPWCRLDDGRYKKSYQTKEAAESFEKTTRERYGNKPQYAYQCDLDDTILEVHFHLASEAVALPSDLEESTSDSPSRPLFRISSEYSVEEETRPRGRAASPFVEDRRKRVLEALNKYTDMTYAQIASFLDIDLGNLNSDVQALISQGRFQGRNERSDRITVYRPPVLTPAQKLAQAKAAAERAAAEIAQAEAELAAEEAARIERERVHVEWVLNGTERQLQVRKNLKFTVYPVDAWREILKTVAGTIEAFDDGRIEFPVLDNPENGMILSGPRAGQIHEDFRKK